MSSHKYTRSTGELTIKESDSPGEVFVWIHEGRQNAAIHIAKGDAPTIAAELLQAAGHHYLAGYIEGGIDHREAVAEREAAEKKLQERRNALAAELSGDDRLPYEQIRSSLRRAIDRIIELEDGQATA